VGDENKKSIIKLLKFNSINERNQHGKHSPPKEWNCDGDKKTGHLKPHPSAFGSLRHRNITTQPSNQHTVAEATRSHTSAFIIYLIPLSPLCEAPLHRPIKTPFAVR
jgi:hypothetical protein